MNLPNLLTISRIFIIPIVFGTMYMKAPLGPWLGCSLFIFAAITDFFDGWLARSRGQVSSFGRFLDPIADKLLVASVLLMLASTDRLGEWGILPAVVIMCREILVSGLREFLAELRVGLPVTKLAKWKTAFQLVALPLLIVGDHGPAILQPAKTGEAFLWIAAILTLITGYDYLKAGMKHMTLKPDAELNAPKDSQ